MVKLRTLFTVFTLMLKAEARDYGKGRYISDECLRCSANHNALGQLANQSRLRLSEGGAGHRGPTIMYRRGLFAKGSFCKGDFIVEYRGEMMERRRKLYHPSCAVFLFQFKWRGKTWCIDASSEDGSFGRLVNDDHQHPNCKMKKIYVNGKPHLCLFALKDINEGEEITYDYEGDDCPWRTQVSCTAHCIQNSSFLVIEQIRIGIY
uniref:SET domain-containing protein n=1 Tax=Sinocyclocheilus anshuiensis TaxID=1608454 RepID=A0A671PQX2_9TELE